MVLFTSGSAVCLDWWGGGHTRTMFLGVGRLDEVRNVESY